MQNILKDISIVFKSNTSSQQDVFINNYCVTEEIRSQKISSIVSKISSIKEVRKFLVEEQRKIGESGGLVAEGRDIGTTVFPDAELKIFLTASIDERAKRRKKGKRDSKESANAVSFKATEKKIVIISRRDATHVKKVVI